MKFPSPRAVAWLWPRVRPYRWRLALAFFCLVLSAAIGLAFPQIVRHLLDAAFVRHDRGLLDRIALLLTGLFTVQAISNFAQTYILSATGERVVAQLRQDLFAHLVHLSPGFFAERRTGELVSRLSADVGSIQSLVSSQISEFARQTLYLAGGITLLTITNPHLMATTLVVVPSGVVAFHDATSSSNAKGDVTAGETQLPLWYAISWGPPIAYGSVYVPVASVPASVSPVEPAAVPVCVPSDRTNLAKLADGAPLLFFAAAGTEPTTTAAMISASVTIKLAERRAFMDVLLIAVTRLRLKSDT